MGLQLVYSRFRRGQFKEPAGALPSIQLPQSLLTELIRQRLEAEALQAFLSESESEATQSAAEIKKLRAENTKLKTASAKADGAKELLGEQVKQLKEEVLVASQAARIKTTAEDKLLLEVKELRSLVESYEQPLKS